MDTNIKLVGVSSTNFQIVYYRTDLPLNLHDRVIVENPSLGFCLGSVESIKTFNGKEEAFPAVSRLATSEDLRLAENVRRKEADTYKFVVAASARRNLAMKIIQVAIALDGSKMLVIYSADERIDFRDLVKELAQRYHTRIEMKQIGTRDRAQLVGGIGVCGLKLCCSTFLKNFDVISINMAKNQLLSLNIPKLSGQCGKLICCLKYEDQSYAELHKEYPRMGDRYRVGNKEYRITGMNLLTGIITLYSGDDYLSIDKDELKKYRSVNVRKV